MKIQVISPDGISFEAEADSVRLCALDGSIGIKKGCADMLIALKKGEMLCKNGGEQSRLMLSEGFAQVHNDCINIFAKRI